MLQHDTSRVHDLSHTSHNLSGMHNLPARYNNNLNEIGNDCAINSLGFGGNVPSHPHFGADLSQNGLSPENEMPQQFNFTVNNLIQRNFSKN